MINININYTANFTLPDSHCTLLTAHYTLKATVTNLKGSAENIVPLGVSKGTLEKKVFPHYTEDFHSCSDYPNHEV